MGYNNNEAAAYAAEKEGKWARAYGYWNECLSYVEHFESDHKQKIEFIKMKMEECGKKM